MKNHIKYLSKITFLFFIFFGITCLGNTIAFEEQYFSSLHVFGDIENQRTKICQIVISDENCFVLPSSVTPEKVNIYADFPQGEKIRVIGENYEANFVNGMSLDLNKYCKNQDYILKFVQTKDEVDYEYKIRFLFSNNISAMYLISESPIDKGRLWVESSKDKKNKATGFMVLQKESGELIYNGELTQIKGRGNSTWMAEKKPYQIKTSEKVDLLETGNSSNASKTWVLLANYVDHSLLRNTIALNLGRSLGLKYGIESTHLDLYYDGEYRGNYLLTEKVEIDSGRVDIDNLEDKNFDSNSNIDFEKLQIKTAKTNNGSTYVYCDKMNSPENITGGYLLEMDYEDRAQDEICYFSTSRGQYIVVKSPEYASKDEMEYIATLYQEYEDAVFNNGINPYSGKQYYDYVDAESTAIYYLVNEFAKTKDFFSSSAYLYKPMDEEKLYMGPLWDFDSGFGINRVAGGEYESAIGLSHYNTKFGAKLLSNPHFYNTVQNLFNNKFYPLIKNVILGNENIESLSFLENYLEKSAENNIKLWNENIQRKEEIEKLRNYIEERINYLKSVFDSGLDIFPDSEIEFLIRTYKDVDDSAWYHSDVENVTKLGLMKGKGNNIFQPEECVKRAEVAQVIFNMYGSNASVKNISYFSDVEMDEWYTNSINWCVSRRIINGFPDGTFKPEDFVTREDVLHLLYKSTSHETLLSYESLENFNDYNSISEYAKEAVTWSVSKGVVLGDDLNNINPGKYLTRAEFAAILSRVCSIQ